MQVELKSEQGAFWLSQNISRRLDVNDYHEIKYVEAESMLTANRFDIVAKYLYVKSLGFKTQNNFFEEQYLAHIKAFNHYVEADGSGKCGEQDFLDSTKKLKKRIDNSGLNKSFPVPVCQNGIPLDGAHRVAIALNNDSDVATVSIPTESVVYDYQYFRNRGLGENYLDNIALHYALLKKNCRLVFIWPSANGQQELLEATLRKYADIVYYKEIVFNNRGAHNITAMAYQNEPWVGNPDNGYAGATSKAKLCFEGGSTLRLFLIESTADLIKMKEEIRDIFKIEKHSIHINDTYQETIELAPYLFNLNSLNMLNTMVHKNFSWFNQLFEHYCSWVDCNQYERELFCIDGSGSLAAFGIRDVRDIDYFFAGENPPETGFKEIDCHNTDIGYDSLCAYDIIHHPDKHFYFKGFKFVALSLLKGKKVKRNETKDIEDVKAINAILSGHVVQESLRSKLKKMLSVQFVKSRIKLLLLKARYYLTKYRKHFKE